MVQQKNTHLDAAFIAEQKKKLEVKYERLLTQQKELVTFPDIGDSPDDSAQEASEFEGNLSIKKNVDRLLRRVKKALKRIDEGTYGLDVKTGAPIERGRLEVMPEAEYAAKS